MFLKREVFYNKCTLTYGLLKNMIKMYIENKIKAILT